MPSRGFSRALAGLPIVSKSPAPPPARTSHTPIPPRRRTRPRQLLAARARRAARGPLPPGRRARGSNAAAPAASGTRGPRADPAVIAHAELAAILGIKSDPLWASGTRGPRADPP